MEDFFTFGPLGAIDVLVPEDQLAKARSILKEMDDGIFQGYEGPAGIV